MNNQTNEEFITSTKAFLKNIQYTLLRKHTERTGHGLI